jgi:hypothetical protein
MAELKDSGARKEFNTGAVRDISEGKGRCDLLPLAVVGKCVNSQELINLSQYMITGDIQYVYDTINMFIAKFGKSPSHTFLEVAKHYEDGARKYSPRNWEKGIPLHCFIDSGVRHYLKFIDFQIDEPHDRAFLWNMLGLIWTHDKGVLELMDLPFCEDKLRS